MVSRIIEILLAILWCYAAFFSPFSKSDGTVTAAIIYGVLFLLPIVIIEIVRIREKNKPDSTSDKIQETAYYSVPQSMNRQIKPKYTPEQKSLKAMWRFFQIFSLFLIVLIGATYVYSQGLIDKVKSEEEIKVSKINPFKNDKYEMMEGEEITFEITALPSRLDENKIEIKSSDDNIVEVKSVDYKNSGNRTSITIMCLGNTEGTATISVSDYDGINSVSTDVSIIKSPLVNKFSDFDNKNVVMALGSKQTVSIKAKAPKLSTDDFYISTSEDATVSVENITVENIENDSYEISFDVIGNDIGRSELQVIASDDKTASIKAKVTVVEEKMLRTVWVNRTGDNYHYNKDCAGKSAYEETLYEASRFKTPCSKCAQ